MGRKFDEIILMITLLKISDVWRPAELLNQKYFYIGSQTKKKIFKSGNMFPVIGLFYRQLSPRLDLGRPSSSFVLMPRWILDVYDWLFHSLLGIGYSRDK
jgi:hypothetical protein